MPHNSTIIIFKDEPTWAAVISRIKNAKEKINSCVDCKGYRSKKNQHIKYNEEVFVVDDR